MGPLPPPTNSAARHHDVAQRWHILGLVNLSLEWTYFFNGGQRLRILRACPSLFLST
jgi:hypothetical protein